VRPETRALPQGPISSTHLSTVWTELNVVLRLESRFEAAAGLEPVYRQRLDRIRS